MSANRIRPFTRHEDVSYVLHFERRNGPGGFTFDCDAEGKIDESTLSQLAQASLSVARDTLAFQAPTVERRVNHWIDWGSVRCNCGREHSLQRGDSQCECGQLFNAVGQELLPRSQWEE